MSLRVSSAGYKKNISILAVATDKGEQPHHSLQLPLTEKNLRVRGKKVELSHDGKMSLGEGGAVSKAKVIAYVKRRAKDLVEDDRIILGSYPADRLVTWRNASHMFENLIRYALLRDDLRAKIRKDRKKK